MTDFPFKLGRRPPKNAPALALGPLLTGVVPAHPTSADYLEPTGWQMLGNDTYGDCVAVAMANNRRNVTDKLTGAAKYPSLAWVEALYKTQNPNFPSEDNGMDIQTCLEYLHKTGTPDGVKLAAFAKVNVSSLDEVRAAVAIFGDLILGIDVQQANYNDYDAGLPWDYHAGSSIVGGHGVDAGGYTVVSTNDVKFITWAKKTAFTDNFWAHEVGEAWALIWPEYFGSASFLAGVNVQQLAADYQSLTGQVLVIPGGNMVPFTVTGPGGGNAALPVDPNARLIRLSDGVLVKPAATTYQLGQAGTIPGYSVTGQLTSPAHVVIDATAPCALLDRNATITPPTQTFLVHLNIVGGVPSITPA